MRIGRFPPLGFTLLTTARGFEPNNARVQRPFDGPVQASETVSWLEREWIKTVLEVFAGCRLTMTTVIPGEGVGMSSRDSRPSSRCQPPILPLNTYWHSLSIADSWRFTPPLNFSGSRRRSARQATHTQRRGGTASSYSRTQYFSCHLVFHQSHPPPEQPLTRYRQGVSDCLATLIACIVVLVLGPLFALNRYPRVSGVTT